MRQISCTIWLELFMIVFGNVYAQKNNPQVFLNHVYFVVDSNSYAHIFTPAFLEQIGDTTAESKSNTTTASWIGKYFLGQDSYFEIFAPGGFSGATQGNFGLAFKTFKSGDLNRLAVAWKQDSKDSIKMDTTTTVSNGKRYSWFYNIELYRIDSLFLKIYIWWKTHQITLRRKALLKRKLKSR